MPAKNSRKQYVENGYYHVYNRGVEKRVIFLDPQDVNVFLKYLKEYLEKKEDDLLREKLAKPDLKYEDKKKILRVLNLNNFYNKITLIAFCLMPNHFHFFLKQQQITDLDQFMNSIWTRYTMYFNKKYHRVGHLFQGVYKAVLVTKEEYFLHITKYIHRQALSRQGQALVEKFPSSYSQYIEGKSISWVYPEEILAFFNQNRAGFSYQDYLLEQDLGEPLPAELLLGND